MKVSVNPDTPAEPIERGYAEWKRAKVERGLIEARDRTAMIPAENLLRDIDV